MNNIFLDRKLDGVKVEADYGQSMHQDAQDRHLALAAGSGFAEERGHFTFAVEHQNSAALGCIDVRDWCARGVGTIQSAAPGAFVGGVFTGAPTEINATDIRNPITAGGLFYNWLGARSAPAWPSTPQATSWCPSRPAPATRASRTTWRVAAAAA